MSTEREKEKQAVMAVSLICLYKGHKHCALEICTCECHKA